MEIDVENILASPSVNIILILLLLKEGVYIYGLFLEGA